MSPPMASPLVSPGAGDAIEGFRRRPSAASLILPIYSDLSNTTSVELEDEPHYDEGKKNGDYSAVQMEPGVPPHGGWRVGPAPKGGRRPLGRMAWTGTLIVVATMGGWVVGRAKGFELATSASTGVGLGGAYGASTSRLFGAPPTPERCNPYDQYGVLLVDMEVPSGNKWQPVSAPEGCQPVDYSSQMYLSKGGDIPEALESLRNRTVVIYGDSVDRDHNEHLCAFVSGKLEMIGRSHPLSPPYPLGEELPPEGYKSFQNGLREWPDYDQSRPYICHVERLNLRFVNVFHYGFRAKTNFIIGHPHFYPPATIEDRFDQIIVPLLTNIAAAYPGAHAVPDLVEITPGFWGLLRLSVEEDATRNELVRNGTLTPEAANRKFDVFNNMHQDQRDWMEGRIESVLRHLGRGFGEVAADRKPKLLWRALHHIKEHHNIPFTRLQSLDQIGRSVVDRLVAEGKAADEGARSWAAWTHKVASRVGWKWQGEGGGGEEEVEAVKMGLGHRLKVDNWGALMLGQEKHFRDSIHPLPLPGSFLWTNMILHQLITVADRDKPIPETWK